MRQSSAPTVLVLSPGAGARPECFAIMGLPRAHDGRLLGQPCRQDGLLGGWSRCWRRSVVRRRLTGTWARKLALACATLAGACSGGPAEEGPRGGADSAGLHAGIRSLKSDGMEAACAGCTVVIESLATIGALSDTIFPVGLSYLVQGADQRFYAGPLSERFAVGRYGRDGRLQSLLGGRGEAPGEWPAISGLAASPDSLLLVLGVSTVVWFDLDSTTWTQSRSPVILNQPSLVALRGKRFAGTSTGGIQGELFFSEPQPSGQMLGRSSAPTGNGFQTEAQVRMFRVAARQDSQRIVTVSQYLSPTLQVWSADSGLLAHGELPAPWFVPYGMDAWDAIAAGLSGEEVLTMTTGVWVDAAGRLWTVTSVPDPRLPPVEARLSALAKRQKTEMPEAPGSPGEPSAVQDAIIAVYELSAGKVTLLAWRRFDTALTTIVSDSVVAQVSVPDPLLTRFVLYQMKFVDSTP